ncbi:MAG: undecaprenyl/decaprenyl-phosphate alpha-N-acetylglucosaminyl 1-phosphate transferase [Treponema sp.]|jgi:UDP-GlcNAc:undecaprenyl-phosphate GlcNAc-1-phosphate transferase|nr:undecaprenyl/decaprenyl-phosphate alpha-N-acetylglucosaminyl 1-phosphate transferase [Treponema sp.]
MPLELLYVPSAFFLSAAGVALVLGLSRKYAWYDHVNERKIHTGSIPRLGGLGFASVFILAVLVTAFTREHSTRLLPVAAGMALVLGAGIADDFKPLAPRVKLLIQIAAASCIVISGYTFRRFAFMEQEAFFPAWVRYPLTFLWIVGLTNAVNFIDGVDGLAGGVAFFSALFFARIFAVLSGGPAVSLYLCLAAVIAGFLIFNAPVPGAKIFMGDGGSQFLGFSLAVLPLVEGGRGSVPLPFLYCAALLVIPLLDTVSAIWRRIRDGKRIDSPDQAHIHHKLLSMGLSAASVDLVIWALHLAVGFLVYASIRIGGIPSLALLGAAYALAGAFFISVHFLNRRGRRLREGTYPEPKKDRNAS